jgi:hypothetical protein
MKWQIVSSTATTNGSPFFARFSTVPQDDLLRALHGAGFASTRTGISVPMRAAQSSARYRVEGLLFRNIPTLA